jgi:hypothetical protein
VLQWDLLSVAHPLLEEHPTTLSEAAGVPGHALPLPSTPGVNRQTIAAVWMWTSTSDPGTREVSVALSFPTAQLAIRYHQPVPYQDPAANYRGYVHD